MLVLEPVLEPVLVLVPVPVLVLVLVLAGLIGFDTWTHSLDCCQGNLPV